MSRSYFSRAAHASVRVRRHKRSLRDAVILEWLSRTPRPSYRAIAAGVGCSVGTVGGAARRLGFAA